MTEQENRETAIEEMAQFMCETGEKSCAKCKGEPNVQCGAWNEATRLYDAGYRKADEVRKEIAKRFLKMLYDIGVDRQTIETCGIYDVNGSELARFVSQEFGVEVEE